MSEEYLYNSLSEERAAMADRGVIFPAYWIMLSRGQAIDVLSAEKGDLMIREAEKRDNPPIFSEPLTFTFKDGRGEPTTTAIRAVFDGETTDKLMASADNNAEILHDAKQKYLEFIEQFKLLAASIDADDQQQINRLLKKLRLLAFNDYLFLNNIIETEKPYE